MSKIPRLEKHHLENKWGIEGKILNSTSFYKSHLQSNHYDMLLFLVQSFSNKLRGASRDMKWGH